MVVAKNLLKSFLLLYGLIHFPILAKKSDSVIGNWRAYDEKGKQNAIVKIYKKKGKFFGKIVALTNKKESVCKNCKGSNKGKPIKEIDIIKDLVKEGDSYTNGNILELESGEVHKCEIKRRGNQLEVYTYFSYKFARRQIWMR